MKNRRSRSVKSGPCWIVWRPTHSRWAARRDHLLSVSPVEFLANRAELPLLKLADHEAAPAVGRADHGDLH